MKAPKQRTATFKAAPEIVHNALLNVIQHGKLTLVGVQNEYRRTMFTGGLSALSWGTLYLAEVTGSGSQTQLSVICGGPDKAPSALLDGWKHGKAADKILASVQGALENPGPPHQPLESFVTLPDGTTQPWVGADWPVV